MKTLTPSEIYFFLFCFLKRGGHPDVALYFNEIDTLRGHDLIAPDEPYEDSYDNYVLTRKGMSLLTSLSQVLVPEKTLKEKWAELSSDEKTFILRVQNGEFSLVPPVECGVFNPPAYFSFVIVNDIGVNEITDDFKTLQKEMMEVEK